MIKFEGMVFHVQSGREIDPIYRTMLKATVIAAIDAFNQDDEAYVLVNHNHPKLVLEIPAYARESGGTVINLAPRCSAWVEYDDHGIRLKTRLYGIDQIAVIPYGAIEFIHARNDKSRLVSIRSTVDIVEPTPPPAPKKPTFTVVK